MSLKYFVKYYKTLFHNHSEDKKKTDALRNLFTFSTESEANLD